jgi:hypothetical protein
MEPALPRNPISTKRMLVILLSGFVAGTLVGAVLCYRQPKIYEGIATIESPDHAGHADRITRVRAQMVARDLDLENRWDIPFDEAVAFLLDAVRLKSSPQGVVVQVRYFDERDARAIAEVVAKGLDNPPRETAMAAKGIQVKPYTKQQAAALDDVVHLDWLLRQEAVNAGYASSFNLVELAAGGDTKAAAIRDSEDFSRRWQMFKDLSPKIGYLNPPGEPFRGPPIIPLWINGGRAGGLILAGLALLALNRWKPSFLRPYPAKPPKPPRRIPIRPASSRVTNDDPW